MVNAILNGCNGAMGRVITDIVSKDELLKKEMEKFGLL